MKSSWKKWIGWLAVLALIAGGILFFLRWRASTKPPDVVYKTAPVERRKIRSILSCFTAAARRDRTRARR